MKLLYCILFVSFITGIVAPPCGGRCNEQCEDCSRNQCIDKTPLPAECTPPPVTAQPAIAPVTAQPVAAPVTAQPVTAQPVPAPVTSQPVPAPVTFAPVTTPGNCDRHRKRWGSLTTAEQQLYVEGFKQLADQGIIQQLSQFHGDNFNILHSRAEFLPWHRQFIYDIESKIRNLGGVYECFSLPYYDWSNEPSQRDVRRGQATTQIERTDNNMGGDPNGQCISSGPFSNGLYNPYGSSCLSRDIDYVRDNACDFYSSSEVMNEVDATTLYSSFRPSFEGTPHALPHNCIGRNMAGGYSPDDPYFYLHHCFVDYAWALWQDCNDYDDIPIGSVTSNMYNGDINQQLPNYSPITVGDVLDLAATGVSYEKGIFWINANVDDIGNCIGTINSKWFKTTIQRRLINNNNNNNIIIDEDSKKSSQRIYKELKNEGYKGKELVKLWSIKTCEYEHKQNDNICIMPEYFEDCQKMVINKNTNDIDITLKELLNKNGLTQCMKNTRKRFFEYAKLTNTLKRLCDGCYDRFCDKTVLRQKCNNDNNWDDSAVNIYNGPEINNYHFFPNTNDGFRFNSFQGIMILIALGAIFVVISIYVCFYCNICSKSKGRKQVPTYDSEEEDMLKKF